MVILKVAIVLHPKVKDSLEKKTYGAQKTLQDMRIKCSLSRRINTDQART